MTIVREFIILIANIICVYVRTIFHWIIPRERKDLSGQVVVITGSAHGIGREMSLILHQMGCRLALIDINQSLNEELVQYLRSKTYGENDKNNIIGYKCDLTDESEVSEMVGQILLDFGHVDILINNAGFVKCAPLLELTKQDIKRTFDVNVFAHFWLIKQFLPSMIERRTGHIVAISSIAGLTGTANLVDYCASKHAIVGMMTALDCELQSAQQEFIKLTTICPLAIATGMFKRPRTRFNFILPILSPEMVAKSVIDTIRKESFLVTIPSYVYMFVIAQKIIPHQAFVLVQKFLGYEVGEH